MYVMLAHLLAHLLGFEVSLSLFLNFDRSLNVEIRFCCFVSVKFILGHFQDLKMVA